MSEDQGSFIYMGMIIFPPFSAFYLNLQAVIEKIKKGRWQITSGLSSFSKIWARCYSIIIHANCCKGDSFQLCMGPHTWLRNTSLPLTRGKQLPGIFFSPDWSAFGYFNSMCYTNTHSSQSSKNMKYRMEAGWTQSTKWPVTRTQTSCMAVRPPLTYPKTYILRLQGFTGSHSSLLKHH